MTRSHAHRAATATVALVALALAGCGSAKEPAPTTSAAGTAPSSAPAATASASPAAAAGTGKDDPATGIAGTGDKGMCQWVTGEQVGTLAPKALSGPVRGTIVQSPLSTGEGTVRRCMTPLGKNARIIMGTVTFKTRAELESFVSTAPQTITTIDDLEQPASFEVFNTPQGLLQAIRVADGTTLNYISATHDGTKAKLVKGKYVPDTDHRPALRALYDQLFG